MPTNMDPAVIGTSALIAGLVSTLFSLGLKWVTERNLEVARVTLKLDADTKIESLRADIAAQRAATDALQQTLRDERQFRFVKLHERRLDAMDLVYGLVIDLRDALGDLVAVLKGAPGDINQTLNLAADAGDAFRRAYRRSRLFFPAPVADKLSAFNEKCASLHNAAHKAHENGSTPSVALACMESLGPSDIPRLADDILNQFREYYGVD